MGYFGQGILENDKAMDWLDGTSKRNATLRISAAIGEFLSWSDGDVKAFSKSDVDRMVQIAIENDLATSKFAPMYFEDPHLSVEEVIRERALEYRKHLESGRYLDEGYGPAEEALAAAYLVREWAMAVSHDAASSEACKKHVAALRKEAVKPELLELAIAVAEKALHSSRYRSMRKFYLESFPDISGDDDQMMAVYELLQDLITLNEKRLGSSSR